MPLTGMRTMVQIKSKSDLATFEEYKEDFDKISAYEYFFYFVHTPSNNLKDYAEKHKSEKIRICFVEEISDLSISSGLIDWVITRTS